MDSVGCWIKTGVKSVENRSVSASECAEVFGSVCEGVDQQQDKAGINFLELITMAAYTQSHRTYPLLSLANKSSEEIVRSWRSLS